MKEIGLEQWEPSPGDPRQMQYAGQRAAQDPIPLTECFKAPLFRHTAASRAASSDMQPAPQAGGEMNGIAFPLHLTRYGKAPAFP